MTTVVEGIETADQFDLISNAGCEEVQGFYFSKPVPVGEIEAVLLHCQSSVFAPSRQVGVDRWPKALFLNPNDAITARAWRTGEVSQ